jgi:hypothetical protein
MARYRKPNTIEITGTNCQHGTVEDYLEDMLRYDEGSIVLLEMEGEWPQKFTATIMAQRYTPERWASFGLRSRLMDGNYVGEQAQDDFDHR